MSYAARGWALHEVQELSEFCELHPPLFQVLRTFEDFEELDYARAGSAATEDFELVAGPLHGPLGPLPHTIEPLLRKYGLPAKLNKVTGL